MKRSVRNLVVLAAITAAASAVVPFLPAVVRADNPAQTDALPSAREVIDRYIQATGGRDLMSKITARHSTGAFEVPPAMKGAVEIYQQLPDKSLMVIDIPEVGKIQKGSVDGTYWEIHPMTGVRLLDPPEAEEVQRQLLFETELNWEKYYESAETIGTETVESRPAYKVKMVAASDGRVSNFYYDKETSLLVKIDSSAMMQGNSIPTTTYIGNYKDFNGIKVATLLRIEVEGWGEQRIVIQTDEHNPTIDPKVFELPADVKALKAKVAPGR